MVLALIIILGWVDYQPGQIRCNNVISVFSPSAKGSVDIQIRYLGQWFTIETYAYSETVMSRAFQLWGEWHPSIRHHWMIQSNKT